MNTMTNITAMTEDNVLYPMNLNSNNMSDGLINSYLINLIMFGVHVATVPTDNDNRKEEKA